MTVHSIKDWFEQAVPNPTDKNRAVQIGVHFEEVSEMLTAVSEMHTAEHMHDLAEHYKGNRDAAISDSEVLEGIDRNELLDALCDQIVTAVGVAHMLGLDIKGALEEVNRSNWSKFVDGKPVFNENGKIAKGPNYTPPDLTAFV